MPWLRAGTVAVTNGSTTVTGTNADFAANARTGDSFVGPDGLSYEVANVASATVISILPAYKGPTASGAAYAIMPVQGYDKMLSDAFNNLNNQFGPKLAALGTTGNYDVLPVTKGGTGATTALLARTALGLGTAATATTATSPTDYTAGRLVRMGDAGVGATVNPNWPNASLNDCTGVPVGRYRTLGGTADKPPGFGSGYVDFSVRNDSLASLEFLQVYTDVGVGGNIISRNSAGAATPSSPIWGAWRRTTQGGIDNTITSLTGLTTALSVAQGGTGNNTGTASKLAGAAILGTVSQAAGVPTGAIFETGSTANGEYIKYANGTMVCRYTYSATQWVDLPFNGAFVSGYIPWTFPVAFVARPNVIVTPRDDSALFGMVGTSGSGAIENIRIGQNVSAGAATRSANFVAIGRWF